MVVRHFGVLGWIAWLYWVAWFAVLWSPAWNFWNLAVHYLGWVRWVSFIRNWVGPWNLVAVWIYRYDAAVWSVDDSILYFWLVRCCRQATGLLLVRGVTLNYWGINLVKCCLRLAPAACRRLPGYLVVRYRSREGILLRSDLIFRSIFAGAFIVNGLLGILGQVVALDVVLIRMTFWIIRIDLVAWLYRILIFWSNGHGAVLQVNDEMLILA